MTELTPLTFEDVLTACSPGGGTSLRVLTPLAPAGGVGALVSPARVVQGNEPTYAFERRMEQDGDTGTVVPVWTVVIDAQQSVSNRDEDAVVSSRRDAGTVEGELLRRVPTIQVTYGDQKWSDLTLPHRFVDGHIRASHLNGQPVTQSNEYRQLRDSTKLNARPLLEAAPTSLVWGAWDATRKSAQARFQTCLTGEIVGILADQDRDPSSSVNKRAAGRVDPVAASVKPDRKTVESLVENQAGELSDKLKDKILAEAAKKGAAGSSMSTLGLGHIPPSLEGLGGVACRSILRRRVLSFSALRQLRFGGSSEADIACRALLAAYGLLAMALSDRELYLRANCDLVEVSEPTVSLDLRYGREQALAPITSTVAADVFKDALEHAEKAAGLHWTGQVLDLEGDASILGAASADEPEN